MPIEKLRPKSNILLILENVLILNNVSVLMISCFFVLALLVSVVNFRDCANSCTVFNCLLNRLRVMVIIYFSAV